MQVLPCEVVWDMRLVAGKKKKENHLKEEEYCDISRCHFLIKKKKKSN